MKLLLLLLLPIFPITLSFLLFVIRIKRKIRREDYFLPSPLLHGLVLVFLSSTPPLRPPSPPYLPAPPFTHIRGTRKVHTPHFDIIDIAIPDAIQREVFPAAENYLAVEIVPHEVVSVVVD
ncbi:hypothetical protein EX30DRAFT_337580 [Ascodesmis nigricans]|uniref:Uncharacterized protein n=1 Tax=Ascodesmis nigricans TaxID=341454 RepID=A0A4S2N768_9PEZI|nr:hypothetical protein EX30DRAFT_337580 [Ascodesmis nigricans]